MLLVPRSAAESHCNNLKLKIDHGILPEPTRYFLCPKRKFLGYSNDSRCPCCIQPTRKEMHLSCKDGGIFVKPRATLLITDDLCVLPISASFSLFTKLGVTNENSNELTFEIGVNEVLSLLVSSFLSKTPLSEILLKHKPVSNLREAEFDKRMYVDSTKEEEGDIVIPIKLMVCKSKRRVYYAKAGEDFVNLLFSFLTLPLGFILKQIKAGFLKGSIYELYRSVRDLDDQYFKSKYGKEMLQSPKLVPGFCYDENNLLDIEKASYYFVDNLLTTDSSRIPSTKSLNSVKIKVIDPKILQPESRRHRRVTNASGKGFLEGPANFIVSDNLFVGPLSSVLELSILSELQVLLTDIVELNVHVGKKEALGLLVASFVCASSALTNVFIKEPKQYKKVMQEQL